jgi:hypothetical protein
MARRKGQGTLTILKVANLQEGAERLGRAAQRFRERAGEPGVTEALVKGAEDAFEEATAEALQAAARVEGALLIGPDGKVAPVSRNGTAPGAAKVLDERDAAYRLTALIVGGDKALEEYDRREPVAPKRAVDGLEETFGKMAEWTNPTWDAFEKRLEARMRANDAEDVDGACAGCRRGATYAESRGLQPRKCREHMV